MLKILIILFANLQTSIICFNYAKHNMKTLFEAFLNF